MKHLEEQGESYWEHFKHAAKFAIVLFGLSFICLAHAIVPCIFTTTASCRLEKLLTEMKRCDCND